MPRKRKRKSPLNREHRRHGDEAKRTTTMVRHGGPEGTVGFAPGARAGGLGAQLVANFERLQLVLRAIAQAQAHNDESLEWDPHALRWGEGEEGDVG